MKIECTPEAFSEAMEKLYISNQEACERCLKDSGNIALGKSFVIAKEKAENEFKNYVNDFYKYKTDYDRAGDMYNVLKVSASEKKTSFHYEWDEYAMSQFERPHQGSLAELTVGYGRHGGAESSKADRAGNVVSGFHYRWPRIEYTNKAGNHYVSYPYWGDLAETDEKSPYDRFMEWLQEYFNGEEFADNVFSGIQKTFVETIANYLK